MNYRENMIKAMQEDIEETFDETMLKDSENYFMDDEKLEQFFKDSIK